MPHAYIPFTPDRPKHLDVINAYLHGLGIYPIGRFGEWKYVNQDGAILSAKRVVEAVQSGEIVRPAAAMPPALSERANGAPPPGTRARSRGGPTAGAPRPPGRGRAQPPRPEEDRRMSPRARPLAHGAGPCPRGDETGWSDNG